MRAIVSIRAEPERTATDKTIDHDVGMILYHVWTMRFAKGLEIFSAELTD